MTEVPREYWVTDSTPAFVSGTLVVTHSYLEDWLVQFLITEWWINVVIPYPVSSPRKYSMEPPPPLKQINLCVSGTLVVTHSYLEDWLAQFVITEWWINVVIPYPVSSPRKYSMETPHKLNLCVIYEGPRHIVFMLLYPPYEDELHTKAWKLNKNTCMVKSPPNIFPFGRINK